jgi:precorrin-6B methylase 2
MSDAERGARGGFWRPPERYRTARRFDYDRSLLPNRYIASLEPDDVTDLETAVPRTGMTIGYPAWNLLYYSLFAGLPTRLDVLGPHVTPVLDDVVVVETGTNTGMSTIVMAQALKDLGLDAVVQTVELDEGRVERAKRNVENAGLTDHVRFHAGDSLEFLRGLVEREPHVDFAFLDDHHTAEHVVQEIEILYPALLPRRGKLYFDNTSLGGVEVALRHLRREYGGNLVEFQNCSALPPGNAIWQPD